MIYIKKGLKIPENELKFTASGSGGPGGQHVNKTSTRVTLWFDVKNSSSLNADQKKRVSEKLSTRINKNGLLHVSAQRHRSRALNRRQTVEIFAQLIAESLEEAPERKKSRMPPRAKKRRIENKKHISRKKQLRSRIEPGENE